jgi:hypothetical protein
MVNLAVVAILLFTIPVNQDALWLSSGLMQNNYYGTYTLKFFYVRQKVGLLLLSKKVSCCPSGHHHEGNIRLNRQ